MCIDIDPQHLLDLWEKQGGVCPLTGWTMILPCVRSVNRSGWPLGHNPRNVSMDRINQSEGYVRGNVRLVALMANYARHSWTDNDVKEFSTSVVRYQQTLLIARTSARPCTTQSVMVTRSEVYDRPG
jgi:hypothetical protein